MDPKFDNSHIYRLEIKFPADRRFIGSTRRRLAVLFEREWGIKCTPAAVDFLLAVGEAINNAIIHGVPSDTVTRITACYNPVTSTITVEVADQGGGFDYTAPILPPNDHGFGRALMVAGCDDVSYCRHDGWFCCTLSKRF